MTSTPGVRLACQSDPERWFNPHHRTYALHACLHCPARSWCAQQALTHRASWGMWAGIWIDENPEQVAHYLQAIAAGPLPPAGSADPAQPNGAGAEPPARPGPRADDHAWVRAAVTARSSGHCEVMAPRCRYSCDAIASRVEGLRTRDADTASLLYISCGACQVTLDRLAHPIARRLGYRIPGQPAANIPFYWRQSRWVLLDSIGRLRGTDPMAA